MTHLFTSNQPLRKPENGDQIALCGKTVKNAVVVFLWDDVPVGQKLEVSTLAVCAKCQKQEIKERYVYAIATYKGVSDVTAE